MNQYRSKRPEQFWKEISLFPGLKAMAEEIMSVQGSSISAERLFSSCGLLDEQRRSRLKPEKFSKLVLISTNKEKVNKDAVVKDVLSHFNLF